MGWGEVGNVNLDNALYNVQYKGGYSNVENNQIKNMKRFTKLHANFANMSHEQSWKKFNELDSETKEGLRYLYGQDNEYMSAPTSGFESFWTGAKSFVSDFNPFSMGLKVLEEYNQVLTTVGDVAADVIDNKANIFDSETWANAYSDRVYFNEGLDKELTKKYGKEAAYIAKQHLNGLTPGEILSARGDLNAEFLKAFENYTSNSNEWAEGILEDYKQAQLSVGRSFARSILGPRSGKGDSDDTTFTMVSGITDAAFSILTDPLTYVTFGAGKGVSFMGQAITAQAKANKLAKAGNIAGLFKIPEVSKYWNGLGEEVSNLMAARRAGNAAEAGAISRKIKTLFPEHSTDSEIELFIKGFPEEKVGKNGSKVTVYTPVTDASTAEKFFNRYENASRLVRGRTSDTTYFRDSVAIARSHRTTAQRFRQKWYELASSGKTVKELDDTGTKLAKELTDIGTNVSSLQNVAKPVLEEQFRAQATRMKSIVRAFSQSAGDEAITFIDGPKATVADTLQNFKGVLTQFMDKDMADTVGEIFLAADPQDRLAMIRGAYISVFESLGIDKYPAGRELMDSILKERFGGGERNLMSGILPQARQDFKFDEDALKLDGAIHSGQMTPTVANLPWNEIAEAVSDVAFQSLGKSKGKHGVSAAISTVGGAVNGSLSGKLTNFWSFFTLNPRLGMRSTVDEAFMFYLTAPMQAMLMMRKARKAGRALTAATGVPTAIGAVSKGFRAATMKVMPSYFKGKMRSFDYINSIPLERRQELYAGVLKRLTGDESASVIQSMYYKALGLEAAAIFGKVGDESFYDITDLIVNGFTDIGSAESSVARATGSSRTIEDGLKMQISTPTALTSIIKELNIKHGDFYTISPKDLDDMQRGIIQYSSFYTRFYTSSAGELSLGKVFVDNNGLKTSTDFDNAVNYVMNYFLDDLQKGGTEMEHFIRGRVSSVGLANKHKDDLAGIAKVQVQAALIDMNQVFHGGANKFNEELLNDIKDGLSELASEYISNGKKVPSNLWEKFMVKYDFERYSNFAKGKYLFDEDFSTNITKIEDWSTGYAPWHKNFGDKSWEVMDRTVTGFVRQPVVMAYYLANRKADRALEYAKAREIVANNPSITEELAEEMAAKIFANIAIKDAMQQTLKFVDNPHIRSNLVASVRNVNRFARATEDFWRRVYRMKDIGPQALYRARLLHNGLAGTGILEKDSYGEEYFVIPMDNILHMALDPALRLASGGGTGFVQPQYNRYTVKMTAINPSFQEDAGIPFLSGPTAGVSVLALKSIAGTLGGTVGSKAGEAVGQLLIGDYNTNLTLKSAIVPSMLNRVWTLLDANEQQAANHSAILSAIAYNQAAATGPNPQIVHPGLLPTATPKERADYLKQMRISGHNLNAIRSLFGMLSPFSMTPQDSMHVPEYLKENGVLSLNTEYSDILTAVRSTYGDEVSDPYELAAAIFIGKNPGKLIYTVSKNGTGTLAYLERTKQVKDWLTGNKNFIDAYGEAAYFFAPQDGELDLSMYQYMEAAGLYEDVEVEEYLTRVQTAEAKRDYFAVGKQLEEKLKTTVDYGTRKYYMDSADAMKDAIKRSNPLLDEALSPDGGFGVESEKAVAEKLMSIVTDTEAPLSPGERDKLKLLLTVFNRGYNYVSNPAVGAMNESSARKRQMKERTIQDLMALARGDSRLMQLVNNVFKPILNFHSRDSLSASMLNGPQAQG